MRSCARFTGWKTGQAARTHGFAAGYFMPPASRASPIVANRRRYFHTKFQSEGVIPT